MDFTHYYGHFKQKNKSRHTPTVLHSKKKQFRLSGELLKKFNEHKFYSPQRYNESEFIKVLIKEALGKRETDAWQKEVEEW